MIKRRHFLFFIVLMFTFLFIFFNKNLFYSNNFKNVFDDIISSIKAKKIESLKFDNIMPHNLNFFGDDLAILSESKFVVLSQNFKKKMEINHNFKFPVLKCAKYKSLIFDASGNKYILTNKSKIINSGETEKKIVTGEISERDNFVLITESDQYCCEMKILGKNGTGKFNYFFANMYVIDCSINDDGSKIAVCGLKYEDKIIKSVIQIFDVNFEDPIFEKEFDDKFMFLSFFDDKNFMLIGNNSIVCIKNLGIEIKEFKFPKKQMCLFSFDKHFGVAVSFSHSNDFRNQFILIIDKNCNQISKIETQKKLKFLFFKDKKITALSENQATVFKLDSQILMQKQVPIACKSAFFLKKNSSFVITNDCEIFKA